MRERVRHARLTKPRGKKTEEISGTDLNLGTTWRERCNSGSVSKGEVNCSDDDDSDMCGDVSSSFHGYARA